jgi:hypothetical protein
MATITVTRDAGDKVTVDPGGPWTAREQVDWEQQFRTSFVNVHQAINAEQMAARAAGFIDDAGDVVEQTDELREVPAAHFRVEWMLWFAWHRLRATGEAPSKFEVWLDTVTDYVFDNPEPEPASPAEPTMPEDVLEDGSLDPTQTAPAVSAS